MRCLPTFLERSNQISLYYCSRCNQIFTLDNWNDTECLCQAGYGDTVRDLLYKFGIIGWKGCGCDKRRKVMNKWWQYKY